MKHAKFLVIRPSRYTKGYKNRIAAVNKATQEVLRDQALGNGSSYNDDTDEDEDENTGQPLRLIYQLVAEVLPPEQAIKAVVKNLKDTESEEEEVIKKEKKRSKQH